MALMLALKSGSPSRAGESGWSRAHLESPSTNKQPVGMGFDASPVPTRMQMTGRLTASMLLSCASLIPAAPSPAAMASFAAAAAPCQQEQGHARPSSTSQNRLPCRCTRPMARQWPVSLRTEASLRSSAGRGLLVLAAHVRPFIGTCAWQPRADASAGSDTQPFKPLSVSAVAGSGRCGLKTGLVQDAARTPSVPYSLTISSSPLPSTRHCEPSLSSQLLSCARTKRRSTRLLHASSERASESSCAIGMHLSAASSTCAAAAHRRPYTSTRLAKRSFFRQAEPMRAMLAPTAFRTGEAGEPLSSAFEHAEKRSGIESSPGALT
eukprot:6188299-Pleurochrysis_carterae.AAC.4